MEYVSHFDQGFSKSERICSKKTIDLLFGRGKSIFIFPFKVFFINTEQHSSLFPQVLITIPKKNIKKASERNLLKRRIKEAYRRNKELLKNIERNNFKIAFIYIHREMITYKDLEKKVTLVIQKLYNIK